MLSALIAPSGPPARLLDAWLEGRFELFTCDRQLDELARATRYPKIRKRIRRTEAGKLVNDLRALASMVGNLPEVAASRDPDDDFLLAMAVAARADMLVSGDRSGLLSMRRFRRVRILGVTSFCRELRLTVD